LINSQPRKTLQPFPRPLRVLRCLQVRNSTLTGRASLRPRAFRMWSLEPGGYGLKSRWVTSYHWIGLRQNLQETPYLMVKTMVSCRFSLKTIQWPYILMFRCWGFQNDVLIHLDSMDTDIADIAHFHPCHDDTEWHGLDRLEAPTSFDWFKP